MLARVCVGFASSGPELAPKIYLYVNYVGVGQLLVNAVTVDVKSPKNQMSGFATYQDLTELAAL